MPGVGVLWGCSGGPPNSSSAGSRSSAVPLTRREMTPALALRAVACPDPCRGGVTPRAPHMVQPVQALAWTWESCAGDGALALVQPTSSLTLLLHHGSYSSPSLAASIRCIFWYGTLHAETYRFAKLLWTKSRETLSLPRMALHSPLPAAKHSTAHS